MRLVVAQGETIQTQLRRLQEREQQIEQYEQQMHLLRVQNLGTDYLLHSYLKDEQGEAKDEPGSEEKSNDSGVVTEEVVETNLCKNVEGIAEEDAATAASLEEIQELTVILARIEEVNNQLLHEEETLSGISTAVSAAHEQHKDEAELLHQELACVSHIHAQLVADVRQNEQTLRETEVILWQQRKQLELLLQEDTESDLETRALRQHLEYIIHLPPSAFQLPADEDDPPHQPTSVTSTTTRVPPLNSCNNTDRNVPHISATRNNVDSEVTVKDDDVPPPLPSCPPPVIEDDEEEGHLSKNSTLCVSSRSSTSSNASTSSSTSSISRKTPSSSVPNKPSSSSCTPSSSKTNEAGGKDTDSTDSNSDTGLSSLHSSSDEGAYVLDTLV